MRNIILSHLVRTLTLAIIIGTVSFFCLTAAVAFCPGLPALWRPVHYTASNCSRWKAVVDSVERKQWTQATDRIRAQSRIIQNDGPYALWDTPLGRFWTPSDSAVLPILLGQHVTNYYGGREWGVHPGDVVLDCGAHVGTFSKDALTRGAKLVVAIDPAPNAVECLRRNFPSEIEAGRLVIVPKGIWDSEGTLRFFLNGNSDAADSFVVRNQQSPAVEVPTTTIDALVRDLRLTKVDFIKTDIKGATERFLAGAKATISKFHPRMAIATEEPPEDDGRVSELVQNIASYRVRCGHCFLAEDQIRMEALMFQ
jgi:FkbM family methyltransferase